MSVVFLRANLNGFMKTVGVKGVIVVMKREQVSILNIVDFAKKIVYVLNVKILYIKEIIDW